MGNAKYVNSILDGGSGLGTGAVPAWSWVQSLIKELRSYVQKKKFTVISILRIHLIM